MSHNFRSQSRATSVHLPEAPIPRAHYTGALALLLGFLWFLAPLTSAGAQTAAAPPATITLGPGCFLTASGDPEIPLAGDVNGDGRADFLAVNPNDHSLALARMSTEGKLFGRVGARPDFGAGATAAACGAFAGNSGVDVAAILPDGTVSVACGLAPDGKSYRQTVAAATIPLAQLPKAPVQAVTADFDGDGKPDILLVSADGKLLLLHNTHAAGVAPTFVVQPVDADRFRARRVAAGDLAGTGYAELVWLDTKGQVRRAGISADADGARLGKATVIVDASPDDGLVVGRFRGAKAADVVVGQRLFPGGDPSKAIALSNLPDAAHAKDDCVWLAADFNGDGKDDILRVERNANPFEGDHALVYYAQDGFDKPELAFGSNANDGLLDAWKTGAIKPGGLDLKAMGCSADHADVIVEVQRFENVPDAQLHTDIDKAIAYFASLPVKNPDGKPGIAMHVIYNDPIPITDAGMGWPELGRKYHIASHRGITHWMVIYKGGGGQSSMMDDDGSCGCNGMPAVFMHEFGHQLGLDHSGRWGPSSIPTYPSLMNYSYNYQLNGKSENVGFSDGRLSSVVLDEQHLDEYLPLSPDKIAFLAGPPYRYRMKPAPDGKGTLIDWNWNGVFGEKDISADINYGYSTSAGERHITTKSYTAPAFATFNDGKAQKLLLFYGQLSPGMAVPAVEVKTSNPSLAPNFAGRLCVRLWTGADTRKDGDKWSAENVVDPAGVVGEPSATMLQKKTWVAYPTLSGVEVRRVTADDGDIKAGPAQEIASSITAEPTLVAFDGRLALLLWRDPKTPVGLRYLDVEGSRVSIGPETPLGFASNVPVGAAAGQDVDGKRALWIGLTQDKTDDKSKTQPSRWQVRCLTLQPDRTTLKETEMSWIDGDHRGGAGEGRVTLLLERDKAFGPAGRWYFVQRGSVGGDLGQALIGMKIADQSVNGGVLSRRYYDEWTNSRSAPAACWFHNDIVLGIRWFGTTPGYKDNHILVGFFGRGIDPEPMGDFDDLTEIRDYGLIGSIATMRE